MKTSNQLLILLLVLLFSIPLIMVASFKSAIKNNRYVVKNLYGISKSAFHQSKPFKAIKLNGKPGDTEFGLTCYISNGDNYGYRFTNYSPENTENGRTDSCYTEWVGDTLVINYATIASKPSQPGIYHSGIVLRITAPEMVPLLASNAVINIDSNIVNPHSLRLILTNNSQVNIGYHQKNSQAGSPGPAPTLFPDIDVKATDSEINIHTNSTVKKLQLSLNGTSRLSIKDRASVEILLGTASPQTVVDAPYGYIQQLSPGK